MHPSFPPLTATDVDHPLRQIVDNSSAVIFIKDLAGRYRLVNPAFERFFQRTAEQVLGRSDHELFVPEVADALRCNDQLVISQGQPIEVEEQVQSPNGNWVYLSSKFPVFDAAGRVIAVCGIATDISERKRIEEALSHVALGVSSATGDAVFAAIARYLALSLHADFAFVSRAARPDSDSLDTLALYHAGRLIPNVRYELAGTPCQEVFGKRFHFVEQGARERYAASDALRLFSLDSYAGYPLFASDGRALGLISVGHSQSLPERSRVEAVLKIFSVRAAAELQRLDAETSYRSIFESSMDAIFVHDLDSGALVDVNPSACAIYGYSYEEMLAQGVEAFSVGYSPYSGADVQRWLALAREQGPQRFEWLRRHRDGSLHWDEVCLKRASIAGVERILAFTRDISERKQAEQQRAELEQHLRQAQRMEAIGHLTGGIAHDFNNLLTGMLGYTHMAEEHAEERDDAQLGHYLARVRHSAEKARDLIQQMLIFSRGSHGQPQALDLERLIGEFRQLLQSTMPPGIEIDLQLSRDLPPVLFDPVQLEQVLMNLCINARDAMGGCGQLRIALRRGGPQRGICASCQQAFVSDYLVLGVEDSGPGIAEWVQRQMFEPFFTTKASGQGSGMGLSMVHGIVHEYGGHLQLSTQAGKGTCFQVLIPPLLSMEHACRPLHGRVAVVDDEPLVAEFMSERLRQWGLDVQVWSDAEQACGELQLDPAAWDLLILDQCMPRLTGLQLAERLLAARPDLPIALYSGFSDQLDKAHVQALGVRAVWHKPLDESALYTWLRTNLPA
ncbi:PAS domain S-box protein [Pseudomonas sp. B392_1p]|uniref:PAS domain S-box protein n=1 Tax=Pseudomonas sp. B392_1p TaxID=3457507 RepID=UPI003FD0A5BB